MEITDQEFEKMISEAMDELPQEYIKNLNNVAVTYADEPTEQQRIRMKLRPYQTLFGLYEGVPQTKRGAGYNLVLPDRITLFKNPMLHATNTPEQLRAQIKRTLWHEIAHHYGLDHDRIDELEGKRH